MGSYVTLAVFLLRVTKDVMPGARLIGVIICRSGAEIGVAEKYICAIILCQRLEANNSKHAALWLPSHRYRIAPCVSDDDDDDDEDEDGILGAHRGV